METLIASPKAPEPPKACTPKTVRSPWPRFLLGRLAGLAGVLVMLVAGTFLIVQLIPGDPAQVMAGPDASQAQVERIRQEQGLDQPLFTQFTDYAGGLLGGDLGTSFSSGLPVSEIIANRLPFTAQIALLAVVIALAVSVPLGMAVAVACRGGRRKALDTAFTSVTAVLGSIPEFVLATLLIMFFAIKLNLFPPSGAATLDSMVLPILALTIAPICTLARVVRRETAAVLSMDYMRTAKGRRLKALRLYARHALPNLMTSTLTLGGLVLTGLLGGAVIVEFVFAWPGLGTGVLDALVKRDYPVIQGVVLLLGVLATLLNLLVDVVLGLLDPRSLRGKAGDA
ncbi:ABC transporter permease [Streptomyces sp. N35]|uniref:ABC transporter permease n=1 Tax=Streptomyces sp. N35 TaxID=2795730 RepID=UPI0018F41914|nr:ABC transporter permease [Streptomyces sp. N35]